MPCICPDDTSKYDALYKCHLQKVAAHDALLFACKNIRMMIYAGLTRMDKDGIEMLDKAIALAQPARDTLK